MMCYREVEPENACRCSGVGTSIFPQLDRRWLGVELNRKETSSTHNGSRTYVKGVSEDEDCWDLLWVVLELMELGGWDDLLDEQINHGELWA